MKPNANGDGKVARDFKDSTAQEWYRRHRPRKFTDVLGQEKVVAQLTREVQDGTLRQCLLLCGPSGCGKTSAARILKKRLGCEDCDFFDLNAADTRGIDTVRDIQSRIGVRPLGRSRIWLIDECHKLTPDAMSALLKMTEDCPKHAYFIFATTDPDKIIRTLKDRFAIYKFEAVGIEVLTDLVKTIAGKENVTPEVSGDLAAKIAESADGSPRRAIQLLQDAAAFSSEEERLAAIQPEEIKQQAFDLVKALVWKRAPWSEVARLLEGIKIPRAELENFRWLVMTNARNTLLKKSGKQAADAAMVLDYFAEPTWFNSGEHGLALACWKVVERRGN